MIYAVQLLLSFKLSHFLTHIPLYLPQGRKWLESVLTGEIIHVEGRRSFHFGRRYVTVSRSPEHYYSIDLGFI